MSIALTPFKCEIGKRGACPLLLQEGLARAKFMEHQVQAKKQIRILVVDDEKRQMVMTERNLAGKNCKVTGALSGSEALEILKTQKFDVIILDFNMDGMSGGELFKLLGDEEKKTVIFNTGIAANTAELLLTGRPVLSKPYSRERLHEAISSVAGPLG